LTVKVFKITGKIGVINSAPDDKTVSFRLSLFIVLVQKQIKLLVRLRIHGNGLVIPFIQHPPMCYGTGSGTQGVRSEYGSGFGNDIKNTFSLKSMTIQVVTRSSKLFTYR
jgi:hypothetical protein